MLNHVAKWSTPTLIVIQYLNNQDIIHDESTIIFDEYVSGDSRINEQQQIQFISLLKEHETLFISRPRLNCLYICCFTVSEGVPFKIRPYPIPFSHRPAVELKLKMMLNWGVIERCSSPYSNLIVCVNKTDGTVRLCLDDRRVNRIILPMHDSSPALDELLARFCGKSFFSSLDFTSGYWQLPLHINVRKYTTFVYDVRTYQFCVVPFGLNISNIAFGQALEAALKVQIPEYDDDLNDLHIYVDDVLVSSTTFNEHIKKLRHLLQKSHGLA